MYYIIKFNIRNILFFNKKLQQNIMRNAISGYSARLVDGFTCTFLRFMRITTSLPLSIFTSSLDLHLTGKVASFLRAICGIFHDFHTKLVQGGIVGVIRCTLPASP